MAPPSCLLHFHTSSSSCSAPPSLYFLFLHSRSQSSNRFRTLTFEASCSLHNLQLDTTRQFNPTRKNRKPKPSFFQEIRHKWSVKPTSLREKFPWQEQKIEPVHSEPIEEDKEPGQNSSAFAAYERGTDKKSQLSVPASFASGNSMISAPWDHGSEPRKPLLNSVSRNSQNVCENVEIFKGFGGCQKGNVSRPVIQESNSLEREVDYNGKCQAVVKIDTKPTRLRENKEAGRGKRLQIDGKFPNSVSSWDERDGESVRLPWKKERHIESLEEERLKNSNTDLAEKLIPENELRRLRNVALRMVERIKVGAGGVTEALVDSIHEKWKVDEVVKLKFEGPPATNMRRTHGILESRTGGLVIWRAGSSVVLYRGMAYKLPCVQSYNEQIQVSKNVLHSSKNLVNDAMQRVASKDSIGTIESLTTSSARHLMDLSQKELKALSELNCLLDELGPRFKDWSGCDPLPIDADLLPAVIPGYKPPFRLLPYGVRHGLRDREMTFYRRTARTMPPHFALGRNRELQGLASAMVKLWEKSAIAKIAIKRSVQNTCNERMAEELKILTGGTLLSRNKDYIVFYRGNDFLPPVVTEALVEVQKSTILLQNEEELARQHASTLIDSNAKAAKGKLVAGTLTETTAAISRWGNQPNNEDKKKMMRDSAVARHFSLVKYLEKKLAHAKGKIKKAEKALEKVQGSLEPAELPTDIETISDEERFLFRKIGLSMKPYLLLGRRGIFDGTIENMHLHWKYRELVKIIVERKSFAQVKHIAISLEAESGGVLVSLDRTAKGYVIIVYRGKNYQRPEAVRPKNLLTKREALTRSIELQRREALKHHISDLQEKIERLKSELENMKTIEDIDEETFYKRVVDAPSSSNEIEEDDGERAC